MNLSPAERRREEQVYQYILSYKRKNDGNSPSYRQIMFACDLASTSQVAIAIDRLRMAGKIRCTYDQNEHINGFIIPGGEWRIPATAG